MSRAQRFGLLTAMLLFLMLWLWSASEAHAGLSRGLCTPSATRVTIPGAFFADGCFDGSTLVLRNSSHYALSIVRSGSAGAPQRTETNLTLPALATRRISPSANLLLPSETVRIPIGTGAAKVGVARAKSDVYFALASVFASKLKLPKTAKVVATFTDFMSEVNDGFAKYMDCKASSSRLRRATCGPILVRDLTFAVTRGTVLSVLDVARSGVSAIIDAVVGTVTGVKFAYEHTGEYPALKNSPTLNFAVADASDAPPPPPAPAPSQQDADTAAPAPTIVSPAPSTTSGPVPAGAIAETVGGVTHTWTDHDSAGGSQGPSIQTGQTVGVACKIPGFRVADGNTWWYMIASSPWNSAYFASADAFYNNGQTSGSLVGTPWFDPAVPDCASATPPPPPPAPTWTETVGGNANTWTNYANAGGTQGPTIPAFNSVQIACKLTGFRVADGNTWWYRIASSPWNGAFYVSADAFYNNGQTSGSLHGTPFVDPAVGNC
jgi:hypothetical protein